MFLPARDIPAKKGYVVVCFPCGVADIWSARDLYVYCNPQVFGLAGHLKKLPIDGIRGADDFSPVDDFDVLFCCRLHTSVSLN